MSLRTTLCATTVLTALLLCTQASGAPIVASASFEVDFAEMWADQFVGGTQVNRLTLSDPSANDPDCVNPTDCANLTDAFFGTSDAVFGGVPKIHQQAGSRETGIFSVSIPSSFFPVLTGELVKVQMQVTDTQDNLFAMDYVALTVHTTDGSVLQSFIGENNGYGLNPPVPDNGLLPGQLIVVLPPGATNTGFDETISSKNLQEVLRVPEPATLLLVVVGLGWMIAFGRRRPAPLAWELTFDHSGWRQP